MSSEDALPDCDRCGHQATEHQPYQHWNGEYEMPCGLCECSRFVLPGRDVTQRGAA